VADFKRDLIADFQAMKQSEQCKDVHHQLQDEPSHIRKDATETIAKHSLVSTSRGQLYNNYLQIGYLNLLGDIGRMLRFQKAFNKAKASLVCQQDLPTSIPDLVDLDEIPDHYLDAGQVFLARGKQVVRLRSKL